MDSEQRTFKELWRFSISRQKWFKMKISGAVTPNVASMAAVVVDDNATATAKVFIILIPYNLITEFLLPSALRRAVALLFFGKFI